MEERKNQSVLVHSRKYIFKAENLLIVWSKASPHFKSLVLGGIEAKTNASIQSYISVASSCLLQKSLLVNSCKNKIYEPGA